MCHIIHRGLTQYSYLVLNDISNICSNHYPCFSCSQYFKDGLLREDYIVIGRQMCMGFLTRKIGLSQFNLCLPQQQYFPYCPLLYGNSVVVQSSAISCAVWIGIVNLLLIVFGKILHVFYTHQLINPNQKPQQCLKKSQTSTNKLISNF